MSPADEAGLFYFITFDESKLISIEKTSTHPPFSLSCFFASADERVSSVSGG
jgi:hypothetical protein